MILLAPINLFLTNFPGFCQDKHSGYLRAHYLLGYGRFNRSVMVIVLEKDLNGFVSLWRAQVGL